MSSLYQTLSVGAQSLYANRQGLDTTAHNIANAQTEGYSRQTVHLQQREPTHTQGTIIGNGVYVGRISRSHDIFMEQQLSAAHSAYGDSSSRTSHLSNLEGIFSPELRATVAQEMSNFFDALQSLANFPDEISARTAVREQAKTLVSTFRNVDFDIRRTRTHMNDNIKNEIDIVNDSISRIASLNLQIRQMETGISNQANDLRDERDRLVRDLSQKVNINYYDDGLGMVTIRGPSGSLLVDRGRSAMIGVQSSNVNDGLYDIVVSDSDGGMMINVTKGFQSGEIKGILDARDSISKELLKQNNHLAFEFGNYFNEIHQRGFGLESFQETSGRNFFSGLADENLAARNIDIDQTIASSTDAISAASSPMAPGDNVVINSLLGLKSQKLMANQTATFNEYYANYIGILGIESQRSRNMLESDKIIIGDLQARREAISGVSLDEEAANMMKWQTAFTASSKVITAVDEMLETILSLKR